MIAVLVMECPLCGKEHIVEVEMEQWLKYSIGEELAQNAFPNLSPIEREQIISNLCPECQADIF